MSAARAVVDESVQKLIAQAVEQGYPRRVSDPDALAFVARIASKARAS